MAHVYSWKQWGNNVGQKIKITKNNKVASGHYNSFARLRFAQLWSLAA